MQFEDCVKLANENPGSYLATLDNDQPRVRRFGLWFADETGFYFQTEAVKDVYRQLKRNPRVEVCFHRPGKNLGTMMRVAGKVEFIDDARLRKKVFEDRKFLRDWGFTPEGSDVVIFRIPKGEVYFWTLETNFEPKKIIRFG
jgi:uncharacterized pyridoxamine 5'-phosphate oxidase family protein